MPRLFIHAINVNNGGGAVLLCDLLQAIPLDINAVVQVDARMKIPANLAKNVQVDPVQPTLLGRLMAERRLAKIVGPNDKVLCFGNLPPLFRLRGDAVVFLQNRYLIDPYAPLKALSLKQRIKLRLERTWLRRRRLNANRYIVQTPSMQRMTAQWLGVPVICKPFIPSGTPEQTRKHARQQFDFLYVASGETHKNHAVLLDAWNVLASEGMFPSLALTLAPNCSPALCARVTQAATRGLRIENLGVLSYERLLASYHLSGALIYPSKFESFGLPLIEANQAGLPVLAPELDYVRDVTDPDETFDPNSPISIANAVKRFSRTKNKKKKTFLTSSEFLSEINLDKIK